MVRMVTKMRDVTIHKSIVKHEIFQEFMMQRGVSLYNHSANSNFIDDFISAAYVLCPDIIDVDGHVFIADFLKSVGDPEEDPSLKLKGLRSDFGNDKRKIEQWVNSWGFGSFFIGKDCKNMDNEKVLFQFGDILVYFWTRRLKEVFPDRNIIVEYGENLMGEEGPTIILYEA